MRALFNRSVPRFGPLHKDGNGITYTEALVALLVLVPKVRTRVKSRFLSESCLEHVRATCLTPKVSLQSTTGFDCCPYYLLQ